MKGHYKKYWDSKVVRCSCRKEFKTKQEYLEHKWEMQEKDEKLK